MVCTLLICYNAKITKYKSLHLYGKDYNQIHIKIKRCGMIASEIIIHQSYMFNIVNYQTQKCVNIRKTTNFAYKHIQGYIWLSINIYIYC